MSVSSVITQGFGYTPSLVITDGYGSSGAAAAPTLASIAPSAGYLDTTRHVTLTGTGFSAGSAVVSISGAGVTVANTVVNSDTEIVLDFIIDAGAAATARDVTVETVAGTSGAQTFTVVTPPVGGGSDDSPSSVGLIHMLGSLSMIDSSIGS